MFRFLDAFVDTEKPPGRIQMRKPAHTYDVAKPPENCMDESFEDLLSKYQQIQLELECIRKEESKALEPCDSPSRDQPPPETPASVMAPRTEAAVPASIQSPSTTEEVSNAQRTEKKVFQAFNIKPLRQKLLTPQELDALTKKLDEENGGGQEAEPGQAQQALVKGSPGGDEVPDPACLEGVLPFPRTGVVGYVCWSQRLFVRTCGP